MIRRTVERWASPRSRRTPDGETPDAEGDVGRAMLCRFRKRPSAYARMLREVADVGVNNRQRRSARQKERRRRGERSGGNYCPDCGGVHFQRRPTASRRIDDLLWDACTALQADEPDRFERTLAAVSRMSGVAGVLRQRTATEIREVWGRGWQPAELVRVVGRRLSAAHVELLKDAIATQRTEYATATVDEAWDAQLDAIGARVRSELSEDYFSARAAGFGWEEVTILRLGVEVLNSVVTLPKISVIASVPGEGRRGSLAPRMVDQSADLRVRDKVRALLSKAESTEFPEEAESLTAKAQELMARHSIDYALLAATTHARVRPAAIRVGLDSPYEEAKATLLQRVAEANSCRAAWTKEFGFTTVVGYAADLASVELLYTSLLVQATAALTSQGRDRRARMPSFRRSFLFAFALRIGQRLQAATDQVGQVVDAEVKGALVPVMAAKEASVDEAATEILGETDRRMIGPTDHLGWASGLAAADLARLSARV
ncbi:MAG: DUF2786 domain-containing protein, partial [Betaproteobacteria bacterium]